MLVGTYTEGNDSKGVYLYDFDTEKIEWKLLDTAAAGNPSFIIPSPDRHFAYAVSEYSDGRQGVYSFALNEDRIDVLNFRLFRRRSNAQERAETHQYDTLPISNFILLKAFG